MDLSIGPTPCGSFGLFTPDGKLRVIAGATFADAKELQLWIALKELRA